MALRFERGGGGGGGGGVRERWREGERGGGERERESSPTSPCIHAPTRTCTSPPQQFNHQQTVSTPVNVFYYSSILFTSEHLARF